MVVYRLLIAWGEKKEESVREGKRGCRWYTYSCNFATSANANNDNTKKKANNTHKKKEQQVKRRSDFFSLKALF